VEVLEVLHFHLLDGIWLELSVEKPNRSGLGDRDQRTNLRGFMNSDALATLRFVNFARLNDPGPNLFRVRLQFKPDKLHCRKVTE